MNLHFTLRPLGEPSRDVSLDIRTFIVAGWAGRDHAAIEHHIEELAALGVPRPSAVPLYYRVAANQLTQATTVQVVGGQSSGEAEVLAFTHEGELWISLTSDHTDRKLEAHSVALSKQVCAKPVATEAWRLHDLAPHWDQLLLRADVREASALRRYQEGPLQTLRTPVELIRGLTGAELLPAGHAMSCGTVPVMGGIRPSDAFAMELWDPVLQRSLRHAYEVEALAEVA